jgi:ABC-2 type transport system ATP-binding protein
MWLFCVGEECENKMSFIEVKQISKTFKVAKKNSGLKEAIKSFFHREYKFIPAVKDVSFSI